MKYSVNFPTASLEKKFHKRLVKLSTAIQDEIMQAVESLENNPRPEGKPKLKPPVPIAAYTAQYRLRIGEHRVLYDVDDKSEIVWILALRLRNEKTYKGR